MLFALETLAVPMATLQHPIHRVAGFKPFAFPGTDHEIRGHRFQRIKNGQCLIPGRLPLCLCRSERQARYSLNRRIGLRCAIHGHSSQVMKQMGNHANGRAVSAPVKNRTCLTRALTKTTRIDEKYRFPHKQQTFWHDTFTLRRPGSAAAPRHWQASVSAPHPTSG